MANAEAKQRLLEELLKLVDDASSVIKFHITRRVPIDKAKISTTLFKTLQQKLTDNAKLFVNNSTYFENINKEFILKVQDRINSFLFFTYEQKRLLNFQLTDPSFQVITSKEGLDPKKRLLYEIFEFFESEENSNGFVDISPLQQKLKVASSLLKSDVNDAERLEFLIPVRLTIFDCTFLTETHKYTLKLQLNDPDFQISSFNPVLTKTPSSVTFQIEMHSLLYDKQYSNGRGNGYSTIFEQIQNLLMQNKSESFNINICNKCREWISGGLNVSKQEKQLLLAQVKRANFTKPWFSSYRKKPMTVEEERSLPSGPATAAAPGPAPKQSFFSRFWRRSNQQQGGGRRKTRIHRKGKGNKTIKPRGRHNKKSRRVF